MLKKEALLTIVFGVLLLLNFASCSSNSASDGAGGPMLFASGEFDSEEGNKAIFELYSSGGSRAAEDTVSTLSGYLEDGDVLFKLNGIYNSTNETYKVSAAGSFIRYTINGSITQNGTHVCTATLAVKDGSNWKTYTVPVDLKDVIITATDDQTEAVGMPPQADGLWYDSAAISNGGTGYLDFAKVVVNPLIISSVEWDEINTGIPGVNYVHHFYGTTLTVLEVDQKSGYWDVLFAMEKYDGTVSNTDLSNAVKEFFVKIDTPITEVTNINNINGEGITYFVGHLDVNEYNFHSSGYFFKCHNDPEYWKIEQFFSVNYLHTYLEQNGTPTVLQYMKQKIEFIDGNMVATAYSKGSGVSTKYEFDSLSDISGATLNPTITRTFVRTMPPLAP